MPECYKFNCLFLLDLLPHFIYSTVFLNLLVARIESFSPRYWTSKTILDDTYIFVTSRKTKKINFLRPRES